MFIPTADPSSLLPGSGFFYVHVSQPVILLVSGIPLGIMATMVDQFQFQGTGANMSESELNRVDSSAQLGRVGDRPFWVLSVSILLRAVHQVGAAVFLASYLIDGIEEPASVYVVLTLVSGILLLITEGMRHRQMYREVSGLGTVVKLILLGAAYHGWFPETVTILAAFLIASIAAHAPKIIRHRLLF